MAWIAGDDEGRYSPFMRAQGLNERVRECHIALYDALMTGPGPLSRAEREAIALAVSALNESTY